MKDAKYQVVHRETQDREEVYFSMKRMVERDSNEARFHERSTEGGRIDTCQVQRRTSKR